MEEYQHSLFFEAKDLTSKDMETIRRHFQKRRESGGGECGQIEKVGSNIYKICFKEKEDQERVLSKKFHTVKLPGGEQRLTVSQTSSPQIPEQTFAKANNKSLEKIFKVDIFLLYYLRDDTKAYRVFQKQLSLIGCTVEFDFVEEWAVVRGDIEKGPGGAAGGAAETWEIQVDRVFISLTENYICHHVLEPKQVKALLQDASFATDDIRVYTESSYPVVVGEAEAVRKKITNLEKSQQTLQELPVVEKQLKLVEEEFSQEMRTHYPDVKVLRQNAMIILDGPDKEVQSGAAKLDELIKKIKEKKVQLPTALITFVTVSSAVSKYQTRFRQNLRNPVSIEVGSDLVLSSLSSDALEEAEAAVLRDLAVATVKLQGAAAVPPNLDRVKEILLKAKNEVNRVELRVDVSFLPGPSGSNMTEVDLVGYSDNVNKLKEILHDCQLNQVLTQEVLNLPQAELVDCFDTLLKLFGMKESEVTIKASHFPNPCVLVAGPRCQVQETQQFLMSALGSLTSDTLVFDGPGAQRYFQADGKVSKELVESSCRVLIREQKAVHSPSVKTKPRSVSSPVSIMARPSRNRSRFNTVGSSAVNKTILKIKIGSLEDEQVNVLVAPMVNKQLTSTNIGASLSKKAGHTLKAKFVTAAATGTFVPGDILQVDAPPSLGCSKIFFIECLPWDGVRGRSMQALGNGLKRCVDLCVQQHLSSVAFPVIGPGLVLKYPLREAIQVLTETIVQFGLSASPGSLSTIHVVIKPGYPDSKECYHDVYNYLSSDMNHGGQVIFRSLTSDLDDITVIVGGGVKLQLVFGDITNETTDAVVNLTDFENFEHDGVCKDILTIAGPEVVAELKAAQVVRRGVFGSQAGRFPCKRILHVCGEKDAGVIEQLMCRIVGYCESFRFKSVAIPAICAGTGGLDPGVVAGAILRGIKAATSTRLYSLEDIRIVLIKIDVFLAFKEEAMQMFSTTVVNTSDTSLPQLPPVQPPPSASADMSSLQTSAAARQSAFLFLGLRKQDVDDAKEKFETLYQTQCLTQTFKKEELEALTQDEMEDLKRLVDAEGLYVKEEPVGSFKVSGLKDGVNEAARMINVSQQDNLRRAMRVREEEDLYTRVVWCIMGRSGTWERLPKTANHDLEHKVARVMVDSQGDSWVVDLQTMQAVETITGLAMKLKRLENLPDFALPLYWDSMAANEMIKVVALQPSSAEYRTVKELFKRTSTKSVVKIERLQNVHLRRVYEAQKKHISDKNTQQGGAGEKFLYHGTTQDNCDAIMKTGFNRRFAGQNATHFGRGTYFAVKAAYSANPTYSKPLADGSQLMFVARVLTGVYTKGSGDMKVPPPRDPQQPHDLYDSAVDATDNPTMYVVFHDNQACPDYLITFQ